MKYLQKSFFPYVIVLDDGSQSIIINYSSLTGEFMPSFNKMAYKTPEEAKAAFLSIKSKQQLQKMLLLNEDFEEKERIKTLIAKKYEI